MYTPIHTHLKINNHYFAFTYKCKKLHLPNKCIINLSLSGFEGKVNWMIGTAKDCTFTYVGILKPMTWGEIELEAKITKKIWT